VFTNPLGFPCDVAGAGQLRRKRGLAIGVTGLARGSEGRQLPEAGNLGRCAAPCGSLEPEARSDPWKCQVEVFSYPSHCLGYDSLIRFRDHHSHELALIVNTPAPRRVNDGRGIRIPERRPFQHRRYGSFPRTRVRKRRARWIASGENGISTSP
jgi:hypothetical protein